MEELETTIKYWKDEQWRLTHIMQFIELDETLRRNREEKERIIRANDDAWITAHEQWEILTLQKKQLLNKKRKLEE